MKDLLDQNNSIKPPQIGKIIEGKIIGKGRSAVYLDLGPLGTGVIYGKEFLSAKEEIKDSKIGEAITAKIIGLEDEDGYLELSLSQASEELVWERLKQKRTQEEILKVNISGANKGGLLTEVSGIPAFIPVSQLLAEHYPRVEKGDSAKILAELQKFIGQEMKVKIFDLDSRQEKLILSEKAKENEKIKESLKNYKAGDLVEGEITGVTDFGVFIKFSSPIEDAEGKKQELEGLIHISELDWQLIEDPADVVKIGDKVKAKIISINEDKVSLSLKALKKDPWDDIDDRFKKGDTVKGKVTKFNPYGVFVELAPKIQGLIHISEFGTETKMKESLKIGEKYQFQILSVDPKEHRLSLKLAE